MRKIFVVGRGGNYANWMQGEETKNMEEADLVVFTGGEDITPALYNEPQHPYTGNNLQRDKVEFEAFTKAVSLNKHIIGICRGSQLSCVASGGRLVQHQQNPSYLHKIKTHDGYEIEITSTHHQAAYPFDMDKDSYKILGWTEGISEIHQDGLGNEMNPEKECEIVYYPNTKCLGIQGHPEALSKNHPSIAYLQNMLNNHLENKL